MGQVTHSNNRGSRRWLVATCFVVMVGGGTTLLFGVHEQPPSWTECFASAAVAHDFGTNPSQASTTLHVVRSDHQRQLQAQVRALDQLDHDWRWSVLDQHPWLEQARHQTQAQIEELELLDAEAGDTEGCLDGL